MERRNMKKYLKFLLVPIVLLGLLSCSKSQDKSMTNADQKSLSGHIDTTDESGLSVGGEAGSSDKVDHQKAQQDKAKKRAGSIDTSDESGLSVK
jgi:hypothetical protein